MKKGLSIYYFNKFIRKIKKFLNKNVTFGCDGPKDNNHGERPEQKYFNFLSRNFENYDKIKIYFEENYNNDINEYQKEYYLKNLDNQYNDCEKRMKGNYIIKENISGSFIDYLKIGNDVIWDIKKNLPEQITPVKYCLPSDGRFREDLQWLYRSINNKKDDKEEEIYRDIGMKWKVMMEEFNIWEYG